MKRIDKLGLLAAVGVVGLALVAGAGTAAGKAGKVTFNVGLTQDIDTLNTAIGVLVPDYDVWNLQYATLTDKAANDFHNIPGLAMSWKGSKDGKNWTYKLRPNLKWSDGVPLTSADIAYTINRSRKEQWLDYTSTTSNIVASAPAPRTVVLRSKVPDPKLPTMDIYILPKHIYEKISPKNLTKYPAQDGVGSGPFTLEKYVKGQYWRMKANPSYFRGKPAVDEIVFRYFTNADAMVFALKKGEIDIAHGVPASQYDSLSKTNGIVGVQGQQGGFDELSLNGYTGKPKRDAKKFSSPNPALKDLRFRQAIAMAIDKSTLVSRAYNGIGTPADTISVSPDPAWIPKIPAAQRYTFDLNKAKALLDSAGYKDTDKNGIRNLPNGGADIVLRYLVRSESEVGKPISDFVSAWLKEIGIGTKISVFNDTQLTVEIGKGAYDMFVWGWTPFVDPDPQLFDFTCSQVSQHKNDFTNYANDASWCDATYDKLFAQQHVELDKTKRLADVHAMLTRFYRSAVYDVIEYSPDLQAYRTDRFTGWLKQPADTGPVVFSNTSPTYFNLKPIVKSTSGAAPPVTFGDVGRIGGALLLLGVLPLMWRFGRRRSHEPGLGRAAHSGR